jgi:hypothetical protein
MAKKSQVKEAEQKAPAQEAAHEEAPAAQEAPKASGEKRPGGIAIGRIVHFHRLVNMGYSNKTETLPAMIIGLPPGSSNFQDKDGAVDLKVFSYHGDEIKKGVMFAHTVEKQENRWTFPERA